jgi:hypothetical protein
LAHLCPLLYFPLLSISHPSSLLHTDIVLPLGWFGLSWESNCFISSMPGRGTSPFSPPLPLLPSLCINSY